MSRSKAVALLMLLPAATFGVSALMMWPASAAATSYSANLAPLNHAAASGTLTLSLSGSQATVTENASGLAATFSGKPFPHVQHIHIGGLGVCPTAAADTNGDGVVSTTEGGPSYGPIGAALTTSGDTSPAAALTLTVAPSGATISYHRTFTLDAKTMASLTAGKAVVVVHGDDPATLSAKAQAEKSDLVPTLPLAATSPALCGTLVAGQTPSGAPQTGGGGTAGVEDPLLLAAGAALLLAAGGVLVVRRRVTAQR